MYEKYDARLKLQSHGKRVKSSAQNATQRLETGVYNFSPPRTELSRELEAVYVKKIQVQDVDAWDGEIDRMEWSNRSGILAAPLGADLFLMTERGPNTIMSSSRFFLDELLTHDGPPDARSARPPSRTRQCGMRGAPGAAAPLCCWGPPARFRSLRTSADHAERHAETIRES